MRALENTFQSVYGMIPSKLRRDIGEVFWNLNHSLLYLLTGAKQEMMQLDGLEISYVELGDVNKPNLVIAHGFSDAKESFLHIAGKLAKDYHILIPDLPGFGKSSKPDIQYSLEFYCHCLQNFLQKKNISNFHSISNSMGGAILVEYENLYPGRIQSMVLSCAAGLVPEEEMNHFYQDYKEGNNIFFMQEEKDFEEFIAKLFYKKSTVPIPVRDYMFHRYKQNGEWYSKLMEDILGKFIGDKEDFHRKKQIEKIEKIDCPVLLLWGKYDGVIPEEIAYHFQKSIPHAELHILENAGHLPHLETPDEVYKLLNEFYVRIIGNPKSISYSQTTKKLVAG